MFAIDPCSMERMMGRAVEEFSDTAVCTVSDYTDNYGVDEGGGAQIRAYLRLLQRRVRELSGDTGFEFEERDSIRSGTFETVNNFVLRTLLVEFTNRYYMDWAADCLTYPDFGAVESDERRDFCAGCESGWKQPEDEDGNPDEGADAEFICEENCDSFTEHIYDQISERTEVDTVSIWRKLDEFLGESGFAELPPLHPPEDEIVEEENVFAPVRDVVARMGPMG